ncbi:MAG: elongation factor Ts [Deltaproteobacteria bacterium]|nr:elongation factor Ts [Deltaproteobacteria bacterium]
MAITAAQVKELRQATGVGMMECKKALQESDGDMDKAVVWLRERGLARAAKKAGRTAAEGIVIFRISETGREAAILELNCETDFSAKNSAFLDFADKAISLALSHKTDSIDTLKAIDCDGIPLGDALAGLISKVGENMTLRRVRYLSVEQGLISGYSHMGGKIGVLVALSGDITEQLPAVGADLAMHVAACSPKYHQRDEVQADELEQEKEIARVRLREQGKPEEIIEKALMGQVNKFYSDVCFLEQPFVKEPKQSVTQFVQQSGVKAKPTGFVRYQLGEGIEVREENFAEEVAAQLKQ